MAASGYSAKQIADSFGFCSQWVRNHASKHKICIKGKKDTTGQKASILVGDEQERIKQVVREAGVSNPVVVRKATQAELSQYGHVKPWQGIGETITARRVQAWS
jgi:hypothetical protein